MNTKIRHTLFIFLIMIAPSLIYAQSFYLRNNYHHSYSIKDYLPPDTKLKLSSDFIRMDSIISNSVQNSSSKFLFQYNENNKITEWLLLGNYGSGWENSIKNELFYDSYYNVVQEVEFGWYINDWDSLSRINYSYETGMLSQSLFQVYNNNSWENRTQQSFVYDQNQNLLTTLTERWLNNNWQKWLLVTNYYSSQNKRDSILFQTWVNSDWQNDKKTDFYYSENQVDLDSLVVSSWNGLAWTNAYKREIVNDANHNQIEQTDKDWSSGSWINSIRRFYTYSNHNLIEYAYCEIWDNNQWIYGDGDIFFHYPNGFTVGFITNNVSAYYSNIVSVDENSTTQISDYSLSQNYPNPFNPSTFIEYQISKSDFVEIKIYDVLGKEIQTLLNEYKERGSYAIQFDASGLPSGIYFYRMISGSFSETKKMILLR